MLLKAVRMILEAVRVLVRKVVTLEAVSILEIYSTCTFRGYNRDLRAKESTCEGRECLSRPEECL